MTRSHTPDPTMASLQVPIALAAVLALSALAPWSLAAAAEPVNTDGNGVALQGYDAVAFFMDGRAVMGQARHAASWQGATWHFASESHRAAFEKEPAKYAPAYGGYCAYGVSVAGQLFPVAIETWQIVDGRLMLNKNLSIKAIFDEDRAGHVRQADEKWRKIAAPQGD